MATNLDQSLTLIKALKDPTIFPHSVTNITIQETHISWVILTGEFAYKIKKPVDLGFLDFSTLALRHQACLDELRLNKRLAPNLYLEVVPITGTSVAPQLRGEGAPFEYAVKMRQFPIEAALDHALSNGQIQNRHIDTLAQDLARFHDSLPGSPETVPFGNPEIIGEVVDDVVTRFSKETETLKDRECLQSLQQWMQQEHARCFQTFVRRKRQGFIRECHGDLHLANIVLLDDHATPFDGIEFSERLRWIDVMSDTAFLVMDLMARGRSDFAWRFLNAYLQQAGNYYGMAVFRFYEVYRALVRAKVAKIRLNQTQQPDDSIIALEEEFHRYITLAQTLAHPNIPKLIIMHGLSGSGKTTVSQVLLEALGAIRLRSDIERKRMFGIQPNEQSKEKVKEEMYSAKTTDALHRQLRNTAQELLSSGYPVIIDATFLKRQYRDLFRQLAKEEHVQFHIIDVQSSIKTMEARITKRAEQHSDASEADLAVLQQQLHKQEPLDADEQRFTITIDSEEPLDSQKIIQTLRIKPH